MTIDPAGGTLRKKLVDYLLGNEDHPTQVITDPRTLSRYQNSRVVLAMIGGLVGGSGAGLCFSIGDSIAVAPTAEQIGLVGILGMVVAVLLVLYPVWRFVRVLGALGLVVVPIILLDLPVSWQVGLGLLGLLISLAIASALLLVGETAKAMRRELSSNLLLMAGGGALTAGALLLPQSAAEAQVGACQDSTLTITPQATAGDSRTWDGLGAQEVWAIDVQDGESVFVVTAESEIRQGSLVVELLETNPFPVASPDDPFVIWSEAIRADGGGRGTVGPSTFMIARGSDGLRFIDPARNVDLAIQAGEGLYRVTFVDAFDGRSCSIDIRIRIVGGPLDLPHGEVLTTAMVALLAVACGAALPMPLRLPRRSRAAVSGPRAATAKSSATSIPRTFKVTVEFDEDERDLEDLTYETSGLFDIVAIRGGVQSLDGAWRVPFEFRTSPRNVDVGAALLVATVRVAGEEVGQIELKDGQISISGGLRLVEPKVIDLDDSPAGRPRSSEAIEAGGR